LNACNSFITYKQTNNLVKAHGKKWNLTKRQ
jgi:hypothetical protein